MTGVSACNQKILDVFTSASAAEDTFVSNLTVRKPPVISTPPNPARLEIPTIDVAGTELDDLDQQSDWFELHGGADLLEIGDIVRFDLARGTVNGVTTDI